MYGFPVGRPICHKCGVFPQDKTKQRHLFVSGGVNSIFRVCRKGKIFHRLQFINDGGDPAWGNRDDRVIHTAALEEFAK